MHALAKMKHFMLCIATFYICFSRFSSSASSRYLPPWSGGCASSIDKVDHQTHREEKPEAKRINEDHPPSDPHWSGYKCINDYNIDSLAAAILLILCSILCTLCSDDSDNG